MEVKIHKKTTNKRSSTLEERWFRLSLYNVFIALFVIVIMVFTKFWYLVVIVIANVLAIVLAERNHKEVFHEYKRKDV